jgi:hypothetical protein
MWCEGRKGEPDGVLPAAGVGHEEVEEEVVLCMGVEGTATEHETLGAAEFPVVGTFPIVPIIGMARQRESFLFHLLVRGGKWQTEILRPISLANPWSSHFHSRQRVPLEPPASAMIESAKA